MPVSFTLSCLSKLTLPITLPTMRVVGLVTLLKSSEDLILQERAWWRHLRDCCLPHGLCTLHWGYNKSSELNALVVEEVKGRADGECQSEATSAVNV